MKLAVVSESSADEAAIRILVDGLIGVKTEPVAINKFATRRGWSGRQKVLPAILKDLHYQSDADALAFVLDSDTSPVHNLEHETPGNALPKCRYCAAWETIRNTQKKLRPIGRQLVKVAVGLAVPSIEAWLRCGKDPHVTEAGWLVALNERKCPYDTRRLKIDVYGTEYPSIELETTRMAEEAQRLIGMLDQVEQAFPTGFGAFAKAV